MPQISVVMTTFNGEQFINEAVQSILSQTFKELEFIIVDDCSTDRTFQILSSYDDPRIILIKNQLNVGQTTALNIGIQSSRGSYIARMDADDVSFPNRLEVQFDFLEKNPSIAVVGSWCLDVNPDGKPLRVFKVPTDPITIKCYLAGSGELTSWCINHPSVMIRKSALEEVGLYREPDGCEPGYPQDYELWGRLARRYKFANIAVPLLKYRLLEHSGSRNLRYTAVNARHCYAITLEQTKHYVPEMNNHEARSLVHMLMYLPQVSSEEGKTVFELFDRYFDAYTEQIPPDGRVEFLRNQIKWYYLPQLFMTNKIRALQAFYHIFLRYPLLLNDVKFYRKIAKSFLSHTLTKRDYDFFSKKILSYR